MSNHPETEANRPEEGGEREPLFPIQGYVLLNLLFWAFCALEVVIIRLWLKDITGVIFFFAILAIGFAAVSIYDCVYDRLPRRSGEQPDSQPPADG